MTLKVFFRHRALINIIVEIFEELGNVAVCTKALIAKILNCLHTRKKKNVPLS
jgi:hypothetical protein